MNNLKLRYSDLEIEVLRGLRNIVEKSNVRSKHFTGKCIEINVFDYTELAIINDQLTLLDDKGFHYSIWNGDCALEDLIDILNSNNY